MEVKRGERRKKQGKVVGNKMQRTVVVLVDRTYRHPVYGKVITRGKKYYADCGDRELNVGDAVTIQETRPLSKLKCWGVVA